MGETVKTAAQGLMPGDVVEFANGRRSKVTFTELVLEVTYEDGEQRSYRRGDRVLKLTPAAISKATGTEAEKESARHGQ